MKKAIFIILLALTCNIQAQLQFNAQSNGIVDVQYGNNYALFDPQGATEVYMYIWIDANQTTPNIANTYNDDWNNASGLVVLTYSATEDKFIGQIDFNTHNFDGEGVLPQDTQINEFNFILRNQAGDSQTGNLLASAYGYTATTTAGVYDYPAAENSFFSNGLLHLNACDDMYKINIFNLSGQLIADIKTNKDIIDLSYLKKQIIIVFIKTNNNFFMKKIQL